MKRLLLLVPLALATCTTDQSSVVAHQIGSRTELIGGPGALGEVGDYLLANDQIRIIVQGTGFSRGFGVYGGAIIDADLQRPGGRDGAGFDNFSEMFPAFFLKAMQPANDGIAVANNDDGSASIVVRGRGGEFLFMLTTINDLVLGEGLDMTNEYRLYPGKRYVEITTTVRNVSGGTVQLPGAGVDALTNGAEFAMPLGDVILFGAGNTVFAPAAGFDLRFTLEALYKQPFPLPQLPGIVTPFLATVNEHVSYGFASGVKDPAISFASRAGYEGARVDDLVVPFNYSSFAGAFYAAAPKFLEDRATFSFKKYFIVGRGDVASIRDVVMDIRGTETGVFAARVRSALTKAPETDVSIVTYDAAGKNYSQHTPNLEGIIKGDYEPGRYTYRIVSEGRATTEAVPFEITASQTTPLEIEMTLPGRVSVQVHGEDGRPLPAKCSFVASYGEGQAGLDPKSFLYDLKAGEHRRAIDLVPDSPSDVATREYLEQVVMIGVEPVTTHVRPGTYDVYCSHGIEYGVSKQSITVEPGVIAMIAATLVQERPTPGWISGDYHLHAQPSVDSAFELPDRITAAAAEGLDLAVATDHNFITDYRPELTRLGLAPYLQTMVGLEMTTLEIGHFNGFPLRYDAGPITKGAFEWSGQKPDQIFDNIRARGAYSPEETVVQVNHPRDAILGYFNQYHYDPDLGIPTDNPSLFLAPPMGREFDTAAFSLNFDALEIYNGKHFELIRTYRVPLVLPPPPLPAMFSPPGEVLRDDRGSVAFPGGMDDWFTLIDQGKRFTATANSDSHDLEDETGYPRTYTRVTNDTPGNIPELDIVRAMKSQDAMLTNGPLLFVQANGKGMGETAAASGGKVTLTVEATAASWIDLTEVTIIVNGKTVETLRKTREELARFDIEIPVTRDSFIIVEARGDRSMWPIVTPLEIPSIQIGDAVGSLASAFGIDFDTFKNLKPNQVGTVKPYAFTNPIYVDTDGNGKFDAPGVSRQSLTAEVPMYMRSSARHLKSHQTPTLVKMFQSFSCH